jgi:ribose/xylose/arabinose/galactoside ABC-type transport system permease subunit
MNRVLGWLATSRYAAVLLLLVGIVAYFAISEGSRFLSRANIENLLGSVSILWIVAIGMTFVVLTGGIDLSVGAVVALSGLKYTTDCLFSECGLHMAGLRKDLAGVRRLFELLDEYGTYPMG